MRLFNSTAASVLGAVTTVWIGVAQAQPAPQQTTATYEDWILRCEMRAGPPLQKSCEIVQFTQVQRQSGIITQIAIGAQKKGEPLKIVFQMPIDAWLPTGVKLLVGDKDPGLFATFKRCVPTACFADVEVKDDTIKKFRAVTEVGKLEFKDVTQRDISLPVSFKGFGNAFDALQSQ